MAEKTYAQLGSLGSIAGGDLIAAWPVAGPGPLGTITALALKTYMVGTLGTAAAENTGTSGHTLPFLDGANNWSGPAAFLNDVAFSDPAQFLVAPIYTDQPGSRTALGMTDGQLPATATHDNAAAGKVGQEIVSAIAFGSGVTLNDNLATNITFIDLTAGDWELSGQAVVTASGGGITTSLIGWASTTSATLPTTPNGNAMCRHNVTYAADTTNTANFGPARYSVASTTRVYLSMFIRQGGGGAVGYGIIRARRAR